MEGAATAATVTNNVNGYLGKNSPEKYADKIIEILSNDEKYEKISKNAFRDLYVHWDKAVEKTFNDYKRVFEERKTLNIKK